jgi:AcrR family transcriptional regulator
MLTYMKRATRKPTGIRRREIADAALRVIGRQGASALTTVRIADEVGVTSGALFRHFDSLEAILETAVDVGVEAVEETFPDASLPPAGRLRRIAEARIGLFRRRPGIAWLLMSDQVYLTMPASAVARLRGVVRKSRMFLRRAIREAMADGSLRGDITPEAMLLIFTGTVHAIVGATGAHRSRTRVPDTLDSLFEVLS